MLSQPRDALARVLGATHDGIAVLQAASGAIAHSLEERIAGRSIDGTDEALIDYLVATMADLRTEQLRCLFLDGGNRLLRDEVIATGTIGRVAVYPREIMRRAIDLHASALILVHNHPGGKAEPSEADVDVTRSLQTLGAAIDLVLHDHIIIAGRRHLSMRREGLL